MDKPAWTQLKPGDKCLTLPHPYTHPSRHNREVVVLTHPETLANGDGSKRALGVAVDPGDGSTNPNWPDGRYYYPVSALVKLPDDDQRQQFQRETERPRETVS